MWVTWRWQKNLELNEQKKFTVNPNEGGFCFVTATYKSLKRFNKLQAKCPELDPGNTPLSVFWHQETNTVRLITALDIETYMRSLAVRVHGLHPVQDSAHIKRWSSHSLRVGAVVTWVGGQ